MGVERRGRVEFVSDLQVLVTWDDGARAGFGSTAAISSESLTAKAAPSRSVAYTPARRLIASGPPARLVVDQDQLRRGGPDA
jgi:hypothetical protein